MRHKTGTLILGVVLAIVGLALTAQQAKADESRTVQLVHSGCGPVRCHETRTVTTHSHGQPVLIVTQRRSRPIESRTTYVRTTVPWTSWHVTAAVAVPCCG